VADRLRRSASFYARLGVRLVILGFVARILQIGSSQSVLSLLSRQGGEFHGAAPRASVAVLFRSSTLPSAPSVVLKDVVIHLALPPDQKLPEALLVSLDRFYVSRRLSTGVGGSSPLQVAPTTSGWSLALYASLLAAPFL
jgi:hypothetical protein